MNIFNWLFKRKKKKETSSTETAMEIATKYVLVNPPVMGNWVDERYKMWAEKQELTGWVANGFKDAYFIPRNYRIFYDNGGFFSEYPIVKEPNPRPYRRTHLFFGGR